MLLKFPLRLHFSNIAYLPEIFQRIFQNFSVVSFIFPYRLLKNFLELNPSYSIILTELQVNLKFF